MCSIFLSLANLIVDFIFKIQDFGIGKSIYAPNMLKGRQKMGVIPKEKQIGGAIGIHGVERGKEYLIDNKTNWTLGCISLKTKDIIELYQIAFTGLSVEIRH